MFNLTLNRIFFLSGFSRIATFFKFLIQVQEQNLVWEKVLGMSILNEIVELSSVPKLKRAVRVSNLFSFDSESDSEEDELEVNCSQCYLWCYLWSDNDWLFAVLDLKVKFNYQSTYSITKYQLLSTKFHCSSICCSKTDPLNKSG